MKEKTGFEVDRESIYILSPCLGMYMNYLAIIQSSENWTCSYISISNKLFSLEVHGIFYLIAGNCSIRKVNMQFGIS